MVLLGEASGRPSVTIQLRNLAKFGELMRALNLVFPVLGLVDAFHLTSHVAARHVERHDRRLLMAEPCGFIGLGIMGVGMARQLREADIPLVVWTRNASVSSALEAEAASGGAAITVAASPKAVVEACARTYLMLPTPEVCHELYHQEDGVLAGVSDGKYIIDCATLRVEDMEVRASAPTPNDLG